MAEVMLVILVSPDGKEPWSPVKPESVPDWIRDNPEVIANLLAGDMAQDRDTQLCWYRAERFQPETKQ